MKRNARPPLPIPPPRLRRPRAFPPVAVQGAVAALAALAGCLSLPPDGTDPDPSPRELADAPAWGPLAQATIRPGAALGAATVRLGNDSAPTPLVGCTANFLFRDLSNGALHLGTAAHCVGPMRGTRLGSDVPIEGASLPGTISYSSWHAFEDEGVTDEDAYALHDFALVRLADADAPRAHPAVRGTGGPTGVADPDAIRRGDPVALYGRSGPPGKPEAARSREGCVVRSDGFATQMRFPNPALPGDSGSPVLTTDGLALAVLTRLDPARGGTLGNAFATNLAPALEFAGARGIRVELATWPTGQPPAGSHALVCAP